MNLLRCVFVCTYSLWNIYVDNSRAMYKHLSILLRWKWINRDSCPSGGYCSTEQSIANYVVSAFQIQCYFNLTLNINTSVVQSIHSNWTDKTDWVSLPMKYDLYTATLTSTHSCLLRCLILAFSIRVPFSLSLSLFIKS